MQKKIICILYMWCLPLHLHFEYTVLACVYRQRYTHTILYLIMPTVTVYNGIYVEKNNIYRGSLDKFWVAFRILVTFDQNIPSKHK